MPKYKARPGDYLIRTNVEADIVGKYLEAQFPDGKVRPETVVEAAKSPRSPIHKYFEWDDRKAAHNYRVDQARKLIRAIVIVDDGQEMPAFQHVFVKEDNHTSYVSHKECSNTPDLWNQVIQSALEEAKYWSTRYKRFKEFAPIVEAINEVEKTIGSKKYGSTKEVGRTTNDQHSKDRAKNRSGHNQRRNATADAAV